MRSNSWHVALTTAGLLLVPCAPRAQKIPDLRVDTDPGSGVSRDSHIAADADSIYVTWCDNRNGGDDIYFNRSSDHGSTWATQDVRLDTDAAGAANSALPKIVNVDQNLYVVWTDDRNGANDVYLNASHDAGVTWQPSDVRVNRPLFVQSSAQNVRIVAEGSHVYVVWDDDRNGARDIYFNYSPDFGVTWLPASRRLDTNLQGSSESVHPEIAVDGSDVFVVWQDARNGSADIYTNWSSDNGASWLANDLRLDSDVTGLANSRFPKIAMFANDIVIAWQDDRNGNDDIFRRHSGNRGATWGFSDQRVDTDAPGAARSSSPQVAVGPNGAQIVWQDERSGSADVYARISLDRGATWQPSDIRINTNAAGASTSKSPQVASEGNSVFVAWTDDRNGNDDIYCSYSNDLGQTWSSADIRLDTDVPGSSGSSSPQLVASRDSAYVAWEDSRAGTTDIYVNVPFGAYAYGHGTPGSAGLVPELTASGETTLGERIHLDIRNALGAAPSAILVGFNPSSKISVPLLGGTILVLPVAAPNFPLNGAPGVPGVGQLTIPVDLPTNPVFIGVNVNFQIILQDAGAIFGSSMSNAIEIWIGE